MKRLAGGEACRNVSGGRSLRDPIFFSFTDIIPSAAEIGCSFLDTRTASSHRDQHTYVFGQKKVFFFSAKVC